MRFVETIHPSIFVHKYEKLNVLRGAVEAEEKYEEEKHEEEEEEKKEKTLGLLVGRLTQPGFFFETQLPH